MKFSRTDGHFRRTAPSLPSIAQTHSDRVHLYYVCMYNCTYVCISISTSHSTRIASNVQWLGRASRSRRNRLYNVQKITNSYSVQDSRKSITLIDRKSIYRFSVDRYGFLKKIAGFMFRAKNWSIMIWYATWLCSRIWQTSIRYIDRPKINIDQSIYRFSVDRYLFSKKILSDSCSGPKTDPEATWLCSRIW